jgi:hypothetical protein
MHKAEIVAISPKGRGRNPQYVSLLIKSKEILGYYKDNRKWLIAADNLPIEDIKTGPCELEINDKQIITKLTQQDDNSEDRIGNNVKVFAKLDLFQLEESLNKFMILHKVFATQVFQLKSEDKPLYDAIVHYKI